MHHYNISSISIDCIEIDINDQEYLYYAVISNYFYQNKICLLLNEIKEKTNNNNGKLLNLFYRYKDNEDKEFKDFLLKSAYKMGYLNKEVSSNSYDAIAIKKLVDETSLLLNSLNIMYLQSKKELDAAFEDSYVCSNMFGVLSAAFFMAIGKDNLGIHAIYNMAIALLFPPMHIFEGWKNSPENIMTQVCSEMNVVSELLGQIVSLDVFSEKTMKISD